MTFQLLSPETTYNLSGHIINQSVSLKRKDFLSEFTALGKFPMPEQNHESFAGVVALLFCQAFGKHSFLS